VTVPLRAQHIRKSFNNRPVLRDISLEVRPGTFAVIAGGNGAGKTTLLRILAKLVKPDDGTILIGEKDLWAETDEVRSHLGFLSHNIYLYDELNALENLRFTARLFGLKNYQSRITLVLQKLRLYHRQFDPIKTYSRGMQQRMALARAILHNPDLLLLDEPFSGLDESGVEIFTAFIQEFKAQNKSAIIVSHNLRTGYDLADVLYILDDGRIGFQERKQDITYEEYHTEYRRILEAER